MSILVPFTWEKVFKQRRIGDIQTKFYPKIYTHIKYWFWPKKINMISNKAVLTRNSAPKLTSAFLVKTALFDIMIFWARTSVFYMCVARNEITNFTGPEPVGFLSKEVNKSVTRNRASGGVTKKYFLLKKCMHCLYTKVCQNYYFTIEQLSALVYTPRWQPRDFHLIFCKSFTVQ